MATPHSPGTICIYVNRIRTLGILESRRALDQRRNTLVDAFQQVALEVVARRQASQFVSDASVESAEIHELRAEHSQLLPAVRCKQRKIRPRGGS